MNDGLNYPDNLYADHAAKQTPVGAYDARQVNSPEHYALGSFQAIDVIEAVARTLDDPAEAVLTGNALKYLMRWPRKGGLRDLKKARWYVDRLIAAVELRDDYPAAGANGWAANVQDHRRAASPEELKSYGIGDVPKTGTSMPNPHPMSAEADRIAAERSPEDQL